MYSQPEGPVFCPIQIGYVLTEHAIEENIQIEVLVFEHVAESDDNFRVGTSQIDPVGSVYFAVGVSEQFGTVVRVKPVQVFYFHLSRQ